MAFFSGCLCTAAVAGAVWLLRRLCGHGVDKPGRTRRRYAQTWAETRNFLRYDGTEMPAEQSKKGGTL